MKMPPLFLKLKFGKDGSVIWLPVFILGLIVLVFLLAAFLIMLPFALLSIIFTWRLGWWYAALLSVPWFFNLLCHISGTQLDIAGEKGNVEIEFV
jgi:hypothetical protein